MAFKKKSVVLSNLGLTLVIGGIMACLATESSPPTQRLSIRRLTQTKAEDPLSYDFKSVRPLQLPLAYRALAQWSTVSRNDWQRIGAAGPHADGLSFTEYYNNVSVRTRLVTFGGKNIFLLSIRDWRSKKHRIVAGSADGTIKETVLADQIPDIPFDNSSPVPFSARVFNENLMVLFRGAGGLYEIRVELREDRLSPSTPVPVYQSRASVFQLDLCQTSVAEISAFADTDRRIHYIRRTVSDLTWSQRTMLSNHAQWRSPVSIICHRGNVIVGWSDSRFSETVGHGFAWHNINDYKFLIARSIDDGESFGPRVVLNDIRDKSDVALETFLVPSSEGVIALWRGEKSRELPGGIKVHSANIQPDWSRILILPEFSDGLRLQNISHASLTRAFREQMILR